LNPVDDIHLRALKFGAQLLFRIDGVLVEQGSPPHGHLAPIISRLKIMANLDIAERRLPQDGRLRVNVAGSPVDLRISTMPHAHGEGAVLRILSREVAASSFEDLGFSEDLLKGLETLFSKAEGLLLVTGPTGSGKSTTLHVALKQLIRPGQNVVTVEDPIEYRIDGAAQVQIDEKIGLTFPKVLRSLLRQDPDVVLIGEIRDGETARIAVQAALTGHIVLATLHTNSAPAAVPRLIDMGVEPYLLAAVLRGVLAQRLVRKRCPSCGGDDTGPVCRSCGGRGAVGRVAVGELLSLDEGLTSELAASTNLSPSLLSRLRERGYRPLSEDASRRVAAGEISAQDVVGIADGY
jgi:general secretion pathway protein E